MLELFFLFTNFPSYCDDARAIHCISNRPASELKH